MKRLGELDHQTGYSLDEIKNRGVYSFYKANYEETDSANEIFHLLNGEHTLQSSAHRTSPVRAILKALTKLDDGDFSVDAHLS